MRALFLIYILWMRKQKYNDIKQFTKGHLTSVNDRITSTHTGHLMHVLHHFTLLPLCDSRTILLTNKYIILKISGVVGFKRKYA